MSNLTRYLPEWELAKLRWSMIQLRDWMRMASPFFEDWFDHENNRALDVIEQPDALLVRASLPGFREKDIDVSLNGDRLSISARRDSGTEQDGTRWHLRERRVEQFYRELKIPAELADKHAQAELENGILTVRFPRTNPGPLETLKGAVKKILPKISLPQLSAKSDYAYTAK